MLTKYIFSFLKHSPECRLSYANVKIKNNFIYLFSKEPT